MYSIAIVLIAIGCIILIIDESSDHGVFLVFTGILAFGLSCIISACNYRDSETEDYKRGYNDAISGKGIAIPVDSDGTSPYERGFNHGVRDVGTPENARF